MSIDEDTTKFFRQQKYNSLKWSPEESAYIYSRKQRQEEFSTYKIRLYSALLLKLRKSILGTYLDIFNLSQPQEYGLNQNKLGITKWDIKRCSPKQLKVLQDRNSFFDDYMKVLHDAVDNYYEVIGLKYVIGITTKITLPHRNINQADADLRQFKYLRILVLLGNNLRDFPGSYLPRELLYLDLYDNFISDLRNFVKGAPKHLLHLGLGRNCITNGSSLHLLAKSCRFKRLQNLDLSSNDIYQLDILMLTLTGLKTLRSLSLEGNPCAVLVLYKDIVLSHFPNLLYLDNVEILKSDYANLDPLEEDAREAKLIFKVFRIMGLPKPPKDNKSVQTIHVEVEFPLMEKVRTLDTGSAIVKDKLNSTNNEDAYNRHSPAKGKKQSPYVKPNEYTPEFEDNNFFFKSVRMPWNKIMEFPDVLVDSPEGNLGSFRDTFKSMVNVRVVYLKVSSVQKKKKEKGGKKEKKPKSQPVEEVPVEEIERREVVLKRITLCNFICNLSGINWSDETVDFFWAEHHTICENALRVEGCLKDLKYADRTEKKKPKSKKNTPTASSATVNVNTVLPIPKIFTCQVGFGLGRKVSPNVPSNNAADKPITFLF